MPVRQENRHLYPPNWQEISERAKVRAGWRCEECGVRHMALGSWRDDGRWRNAVPIDCSGRRAKTGERGPVEGTREWVRIVRVIITTAHLDHNPANCDPSNLRALCQRCHNRYDARHRAEGRRQRAMATLDLFGPGR